MHLATLFRYVEHGQTKAAGKELDRGFRPRENTNPRIERFTWVSAHDEDAVWREPPYEYRKRAFDLRCVAEVDAAERQDNVYRTILYRRLAHIANEVSRGIDEVDPEQIRDPPLELVVTAAGVDDESRPERGYCVYESETTQRKPI